MTAQTNETQWYIARDGKQHGPLTDVEMRTFVSHSYLRPSDLIWRPGMPDWQPAPAVFPAVFHPQASAPAPMPQSYPQQQAPAGLGQAATAHPQGSHGAAQARTGGTQAASAQAGPHQASAHRSDFEPEAGGEGSGRGSKVRRWAFAALALAVAAGGVAAAIGYRDSLFALFSSTGKGSADKADTKSATTQAPAQIAAAQSPAADAPAAPAPAISGDSVYDARLQKIPLWVEIKKQYPAWYATQVTAADKLASEKKPDNDNAIATQFAQGLAALRRQNSEKALAAGPERLKQVASAFLENLRTLKASSVGACYGFISKGEASPAIVEQLKTPENATAFNNQTTAIIEAAAEGATAPAKHGEAGKADYELLIAELNKLGWHDDDLQVFSNPRLLAKREPDKVCQMVLDWFSAHLAIQDPAAQERLLFETLKPVVQG